MSTCAGSNLLHCQRRCRHQHRHRHPLPHPLRPLDHLPPPRRPVIRRYFSSIQIQVNNNNIPRHPDRQRHLQLAGGQRTCTVFVQLASVAGRHPAGHPSAKGASGTRPPWLAGSGQRQAWDEGNPQTLEPVPDPIHISPSRPQTGPKALIW